VGFAEHHTPIALIGPGGIGKTSIALTVLHDDRIKQRFGDNRRFIRCDQFPASLTHFLGRLSKVTGAGIDNPEDLTPLQPFLSSREMVIVLDNAESILDPQGTDAEEIYAVAEELGRFSNIWLCITSRVSTIPPDCETLDIPTLTMEAAHETFRRIYRNIEQSDLVNKILEQLDFHPLSITLLATVAHHNKWNIDRLAREWEVQRTGLLRTRQKKSLAATIELSLASPMFQELGPYARNLLGVVAFFPQGVNENNLDRLFPTISNPADIFDEFCILSLTYRSDGFLTMLAPLRDYLCPKDPESSPLLVTTKERYFSRLSVGTGPEKPGPEETRWIASEDANVEHLLDVFTSIDADSDSVWEACVGLIRHLRWHKQRSIILGPKIEGLPDGHRSKPECLLRLSRLLQFIGMRVEAKRLLITTLELWRKRGDDRGVARTLATLAFVNGRMGHMEEGILQAKEALEIYERLDDTVRQAKLLQRLALLFAEDDRIDDAEEAASRAMNLSSDEQKQYQTSEHHHVLSHIHHSRGETEVAIGHLKTALGIASSFNSRDKEISVLFCLVMLLFDEDRFDDTQIYLERLKPYLVNHQRGLGTVMLTQASIWHRQGRIEDAKSEALRATIMLEKSGASADELRGCREFLQEIEEELNNPVTSNESDDDGELIRTLLLVFINSLRTESE
jgi:tetratricopeptide (TPR) repeat protein